MRRAIQLLALLGLTALSIAAHADCGPDASEAAIRDCLAQDLRDSDKRINADYRLLMGNLDQAGKATLLKSQRDWLETRDKACALDTRESNREKWLQAILASPKKTVCVVRYTFTRVADLDTWLAAYAPGKTVDGPAPPRAPQFTDFPVAPGKNPQPPLPASLEFLDDGYKAFTTNGHERGKWYFEVSIDRGSLAKSGDQLIMPGIYSKSSTFSLIRMINIRRSQAGMRPVVVGIAVDLDQGFFYVRQDGEWNVTPGVSGGLAVPMNATYHGTIEGSSLIREFVRSGEIKINVGERSFDNSIPAGYRPWGGG